jgi:hypothetical protein
MNKKANDNQEYDPTKDFQRLESLIERCRIKYEMYFSGSEKKEPHYLRRECKKLIGTLRRTHLRKVSYRFRREGLVQKFAVLERYWERVKYSREQGTYYKDRMRARRRGLIEEAPTSQTNLPAAEEQENKPEPKIYNLGDGATSDTFDAGIPKERVLKIYQEFLKARQECNQSTEKINMRSVAKTIAKQMPHLEKKGYTNIDFRVVVKDGKAALKAVGKKKKAPPAEE